MPPRATTRLWLLIPCLALAAALAGCGKTKEEPAAGPAVSAAAEGHLDAANAEIIGGWAWDPQNPDARLQVDLYDGGAKFQTVPADLLREDLRGKKGDGKYGFSIPTPAALKDGKTHTVKAVIAGTSIELNGSPKKLTAKGR